MSLERKLTALVVDDDPGVREFVAHVLALEGFSVAALDASEALTRLDRGDRFDLLVTDYEMPRITGVELAGEFRKVCPESRVVVMTGNMHEAILCADLHAVTNRVLEKPFGLECLRTIVLEIRERLAPSEARDGRFPDARKPPRRFGIA